MTQRGTNYPIIDISRNPISWGKFNISNIGKWQSQTIHVAIKHNNVFLTLIVLEKVVYRHFPKPTTRRRRPGKWYDWYNSMYMGHVSGPTHLNYDKMILYGVLRMNRTTILFALVTLELLEITLTLRVWFHIFSHAYVIFQISFLSFIDKFANTFECRKIWRLTFISMFWSFWEQKVKGWIEALDQAMVLSKFIFETIE